MRLIRELTRKIIMFEPQSMKYCTECNAVVVRCVNGVKIKAGYGEGKARDKIEMPKMRNILRMRK